MRNETQTMCDRHTRNKQTYSRERKLYDVVVHLLHSDSILPSGLKPVRNKVRVTRPQDSVWHCMCRGSTDEKGLASSLDHALPARHSSQQA